MPARRRVGTLRQVLAHRCVGRGQGNREGCGGQAVGLLASQELLRSSSGHVGIALVTVSATFGSEGLKLEGVGVGSSMNI